MIVTQPTCGYSSGSIVVEATNGTPPYTYTRIDQYSSYTQQTGNFPVAIAGTFLMRVTDANGLIGEQVVTLTDIAPGPVRVLPETIKVPSKCNLKDGSISLKVTGGTPPYSYSIDGINWQISNTFSNLYQGIYDFLVKDANGCLGRYTSFATFYAVNACMDNGLIGGGSGSACGPSSNVNLTIQGSNGPYQYSMDGVNYQATGVFPNIGPGVYQVFIKKANGEILAWGFNRTEYCVLSIEYVAVSASCFGSNGELEVVASQGKPPYQYSIDGINYQTSNVFKNLAPGNYSITVRDDIGVQSSIRATVFDKCPIVNAVSKAETCTGNDGAITAGGFRGTEPYRYSLDGVNFQTSPDFTGLKTGMYTIIIKDDLGFTGTTNITVPYSCLQMQTVQKDATCGLNNGSIKITANNGVEPYLYSLDGITYGTANTFTNLTPGIFNVAVKDAINNVVKQAVAIKAVTTPILQLDTLPTSCLKTDGKVTLGVTGGVAPYLYSFDGVNYAAETTLQNVKADSLITAFVKDKNGCISSKSFKLSAHCPVVGAASRSEICDQINGIITVNVSDGFGPYQYSLDGINYQVSNIFSSLKSGDYSITVRDAVGIKNGIMVTVLKSCTIATASITNETCSYANGSVFVNADKGTAPYMYSIDNSNYQASNLFNGLRQGDYTVTVRDALLTEIRLSVKILNTPGPVVSITNNPVSCNNNDGKIEVLATGGKQPYTYSIDGANFGTGNIFTGLPKGVYQISVRDANGCTSVASATVELVSELRLSVEKAKEVCEGSYVQLNAVSNGTQFSWIPVAALNNSTVSNPIASPQTTTKYFIEVTKGICKANDSVDVNVNPAPIAVAKKDTTICYGQSARLVGEGGIQYSWSPNQFLDNPLNDTVNINSPTVSTTYQLKVTDMKGCTSLNNAAVTITVKPPPKLFAGNDISVAKGEPLQLFAIDVNNTGFIYFDWQPGTGLSNNRVQNPVAVLSNNITYRVTASTSEGCKAMDTLNITVFDKPDIFVPTGFTPNNDGLNDLLVAVPVGIKSFNYFKVYNRWGQVVFSGKDFASGWNGYFKNEQQIPGIYSWVVSGTDYKGNIIKKSGTVTLIR
ncbi:T9SS type B sorting domain-containing protein [Lacibacter luteus]|uniref:T9SS type B sorting domain-containing protein n=1 Tax=Lacibacter luteus TaxID=2508719 RepID=UPI0013E91DA8|nr:gliding motility-associated C-terminal domain-containing protein [Lacibacter luteus]